MSTDRYPYRLNQGLKDPAYVFANVGPASFVIAGVTVQELTGRITRVRFVRKRFEKKCLVCYSPDAIRTKYGQYCEDCGHPQCRAYVRVHLAYDAMDYIIDLGTRSAQNFFHMQAEALRLGQHIAGSPLRLTVENHGNWGEVRFEWVRSHSLGGG